MNLIGWRFPVALAGFVGVMGTVLYPIAISPMMDSQHYKKVQKVTRANVDQEKIQPGGMKVWSDPFKPLPGKEL